MTLTQTKPIPKECPSDSTPLLFPGNALTHVAPGTRFEMLPRGVEGNAVEYGVGTPSVLREVLPEGSLLQLQLDHGLQGVQNEGDVPEVSLEARCCSPWSSPT